MVERNAPSTMPDQAASKSAEIHPTMKPSASAYSEPEIGVVLGAKEDTNAHTNATTPETISMVTASVVFEYNRLQPRIAASIVIAT